MYEMKHRSNKALVYDFDKNNITSFYTKRYKTFIVNIHIQSVIACTLVKLERI